jgi:hypothetical protein
MPSLPIDCFNGDTQLYDLMFAVTEMERRLQGSTEYTERACSKLLSRIEEHYFEKRTRRTLQNSENEITVRCAGNDHLMAEVTYSKLLYITKTRIDL